MAGFRPSFKKTTDINGWKLPLTALAAELVQWNPNLRAEATVINPTTCWNNPPGIKAK